MSGAPSHEWPVRPHQVQPIIERWERAFPRWVKVIRREQFTGYPVHAITLANHSSARGDRKSLLIAVPHAHEPAGTVACLSVMSQLLEGRDLTGRPTSLPREQILEKLVISFIPDSNPDGRARAPEDVWDGTRRTNQQFLDFVFGVAREGGRFTRYGRWQISEHQPQRIGFAYEPLDADTYVEPNRDPDSSHTLLLRELRVRYGADLALELHQTEFERSDHDCVALLPITQEELPPEVRAANQALAERMTRMWRDAHANPQSPRTLSYTGQQRDYIVTNWGRWYREVPTVASEVQNNNPRTPAIRQRLLCELAIEAAIRSLMASG